MKEYNLRTEPKFIVFFTQLLTLFQICHECKCANTLVEVNAHGTMAEVITICVNPGCGKRPTWFSQPNFPGTKIAAGNLSLSFGMLVAGTSATKVFRVLRHMGMTCVTNNFLQISTSKCAYGMNVILVMVAKFVLSSPKSSWL